MDKLSLHQGPADPSYSVYRLPGGGGGGWWKVGKEPEAGEFTAEFTAKLTEGAGIQEPSGGGSDDG